MADAQWVRVVSGDSGRTSVRIDAIVAIRQSGAKFFVRLPDGREMQLGDDSDGSRWLQLVAALGTDQAI